MKMSTVYLMLALMFMVLGVFSVLVGLYSFIGFFTTATMIFIFVFFLLRVFELAVERGTKKVPKYEDILKVFNRAFIEKKPKKKKRKV